MSRMLLKHPRFVSLNLLKLFFINDYIFLASLIIPCEEFPFVYHEAIPAYFVFALSCPLPGFC